MRGGIQHGTMTSGLPQPQAPLGRDEVLESSIVIRRQNHREYCGETMPKGA